MATGISSHYKRRLEGGCWPTREQELLLRASLLQGNKALHAWRIWKDSIDLDAVDEGSRRMLPLLYHNLHRLGVEDPVLNRYKGNYRLTWYDNQIKFHQLGLLLDQFHRAGVKTMILKGAALTLLHYRDYGLRPMNDLDVMVQKNKVRVAANLLTDSGWTAKEQTRNELSNALLLRGHSKGFVRGVSLEIDLHWHLLEHFHLLERTIHTGLVTGLVENVRIDEFWDGAIPVQLGDVSTNALNPTDQLFHVCTHGARFNSTPPFRWVADAVTILNTSQTEIDWNHLVNQSEKLHLVLPIRDTLRFLNEKLDVAIPLEVIKYLQSFKAPKHQHLGYRLATHPKGLLGLLPLYLYYYLGNTKGQNMLPRLKGFAEYLKLIWGKKFMWQLPIYITIKGVKRIWNVAKEYVRV